MAGGSGKLAQSNRTRLSWFSTGCRMSDATTNSSRLSLPASDDASAEKKAPAITTAAGDDNRASPPPSQRDAQPLGTGDGDPVQYCTCSYCR